MNLASLSFETVFDLISRKNWLPGRGKTKKDEVQKNRMKDYTGDEPSSWGTLLELTAAISFLNKILIAKALRFD